MVLAAPVCLRSPRVALAVSVLGFAGAIQVKSEALVFGIVATVIALIAARTIDCGDSGGYLVALLPPLRGWLSPVCQAELRHPQLIVQPCRARSDLLRK